MARIWEGVVKGSPTLDDLLGLSALEWRTGPEMNMDEMNERSNAKASPRVFALVRTKHAAFSHVQQKASRMFYFGLQCLYRKPFWSGSCLDSRAGKVVLSSLQLKLDVCYA